MKQIVVNPSDTIQIVSNNVEHIETDTFSSSIADSFTGLLNSCSHALFFNWLDGLNILVALLAFVFLISIFIPKVKITLFRHLKIQAFVIWVCGVVLYMVGFNEHGSAASNIALLLRSCLSSMEMFVSHSDLVTVKK